MRLRQRPDGFIWVVLLIFFFFSFGVLKVK